MTPDINFCPFLRPECIQEPAGTRRCSVCVIRTFLGKLSDTEDRLYDIARRLESLERTVDANGPWRE